MEGNNLVAIYGSRTEAERARDRLLQAGIPDVDIRLSAADLSADDTLRAGRAQTGRMETLPPASSERREGFWDWLFGRDIPQEHRGWYETNLRQGRTALSVFVRTEAQRPFIEEILDEFSPLAFEDETMVAETAAPATRPSEMVETRPLTDREQPPATTPLSGSLAGEPAAPPLPMADRPPIGADMERTRLERAEQTEEQVIPVVKEELAVGKRASERRYRIRTYVVETPVEREIPLRDERVVVERRPVAGDSVGGGAALPQEREFEVVERHEEPVVEKRTRNVEEVVIHKEANPRTETVRDTVRETRVEVENEAGAPAENLETGLPADRRRP